MPAAWWTKVIAFAVAIIASIIILIPTFQPDSFLADRVDARITPGLDLQGGLHLQYNVDVDKAISDKLDRYEEEIAREIRNEHPDADVRVQRVEGTTTLRVTSETHDPDDLINMDSLQLLNLEPVSEAGGGLRLELSTDYIEETKAWAMQQAVETIRKRIDALGVSEPSITTRGQTDIIVQLPGLGEEQFESAKQLIGRAAQLEFQMVSPRDGSFFTSVDVPAGTEGIEVVGGRPQATDLETFRAFFSTIDPPDGTEILPQKLERFDPTNGQMVTTGYQPMLLTSRVELTGEYITDARVQIDPRDNRPYVGLNFDSEGARIFADLTGEHVDEQMAIVLDDTINSAPRINERIAGGRAQITMGSSGNYNQIYSEAENLAIVLRNGALPAPIEKQFETQVGPTLGQDSIEAGVRAAVVAFVLVMIFILYYYKLAGVAAALALLLNMLFILSALALFGATLTLPGIAGITLTIGMAVDANVIVFERIKEELRLGKTVRSSLDAGYEKAMSAVLDANITTGIAALVLWQYGSGPVRGFAITLLIGIVSSLFTALVFTRLFFDLAVDRFRINRLPI